jgi:hypothetical protein
MYGALAAVPVDPMIWLNPWFSIATNTTWLNAGMVATATRSAA